LQPLARASCLWRMNSSICSFLASDLVPLTTC
jgi:hypothetical protein